MRKMVAAIRNPRSPIFAACRSLRSRYNRTVTWTDMRKHLGARSCWQLRTDGGGEAPRRVVAPPRRGGPPTRDVSRAEGGPRCQKMTKLPTRAATGPWWSWSHARTRTRR
jgi:hypothetical protein